MTTLSSALPLMARLADIGGHPFSRHVQTTLRTFVRGRPQTRSLEELDDWILRDIGLERQDKMSPEARRSMNRMMTGGLW